MELYALLITGYFRCKILLQVILILCRCFRYPNPVTEGPTVDEEANYFLTYRCNASATAWVGDADYDEFVLDVDDALTEPPCNADNLSLNPESYNQEGLLIQCTGEGVQIEGSEKIPVVPAPNTCLLQCDFYPVLTFYSDWKHEFGGTVNMGQKIWFYRMYDDPTEVDELDTDPKHDYLPNSVKNMIRCWE